MKADALTPRQLFDGKMHYEIPSFQRPYVWNEEDQWAPLWEDILRVAVSYLPSESGAAVD
ncbi:MAG: GmrSD restriction endonuclease domain-containing protein, partial [Cellulosimicrobium funkei]